MRTVFSYNKRTFFDLPIKYWPFSEPLSLGSHIHKHFSSGLSFSLSGLYSFLGLQHAQSSSLKAWHQLTMLHPLLDERTESLCPQTLTDSFPLVNVPLLWRRLQVYFTVIALHFPCQKAQGFLLVLFCFPQDSPWEYKAVFSCCPAFWSYIWGW